MNAQNGTVRQLNAAQHTTLVTVYKVSPTGSKPILADCLDGNTYWCKHPENDHGRESVVNEIVASEIGKCIGAPVRPWKLVGVPDELVGDLLPGRVRLKSGFMFGSLLLEDSQFSYDVDFVARDGNHERLPKLVALWLLCHAQDLQLLYEPSADFKAWSIDHGLWFGSDSGVWQLDSVEKIGGRTSVPPVQGAAPEDWIAACEAVQKLDRSDLNHVPAMIPSDWGIQRQDIERLLDFATSRVGYAKAKLEEFARTESLRRR